MDKGYYDITKVNGSPANVSQSTIKMDKGYYLTCTCPIQVHNHLSQSTIKMDKGYYIIKLINIKTIF